jgi:hypothetical protein
LGRGRVLLDRALVALQLGLLVANGLRIGRHLDDG